MTIYAVQDYETEVLTASLRHPQLVAAAARSRAGIATMPFAVMDELFNHSSIENERLQADWAEYERRPCRQG